MGGKGSGGGVSGGGSGKPAWLRKAEGNRARKPIREPMDARGSLPPPPDNFTEDQIKCWDQICLALPPGVLVNADANVVERCAVAWATFRQCNDFINRTGLIVKSPQGGPMRNPALITRNYAAREMATASMEIGLSPLARTRIGMQTGGREDPMELLMDGDPSSWADLSMETDDAFSS